MKAVKKRYRTYTLDDCISYTTECACGEKVGAWTELQANQLWNDHKCGENKIKERRKLKRKN